MSLRMCGSGFSGAASTASKSSIGSARRTPRRRIASMILWRAMALTHGASLGPPSQVPRFRWIANRVSCTTSSISASPTLARAKAPRAIALTDRPMSSSKRR